MVGRRIEAGGSDRVVPGSSLLLDLGMSLDRRVVTTEHRGVSRPSETAVEVPPAPGPVRSISPPLSVDERSALYLLSMARDLLKSDHPSVAAMIDYAMLDVAIGQPD